jgi:catechol 2,3-dioxygenase-like lactoylglutathione lyase family enzyme
MIDHIGIKISDLAKSKAFYEKALAPLGYSALKSFMEFVGYGVAPKPDFWIDGRPNPAKIENVHVAFRAKGRAEVRAFYEAAIAAGGRDNGAPGVREHYHEHYYGAFVLDPDGHNIEACCHEPYLG